MSQTCAILFFQKFLHWGLFTDLYTKTEWVKHWYAIILYCNISSAIIGNMICVVNRYLALCHCCIYMKKWTLKWSFGLVIIQIFLPIIMFCFNFWYEAYPVYAPPLHIYIFMVQNPLASMINNAFISLLSGFASLITISMNLIMISKYNKLMSNISKNEKAKRISMLFYAIFTTITLAALSVQQCTRLVFVFKNYTYGLYYVTYYLFIIIPMMACIQPYILLILSKSVRVEFLKFYFRLIISNKIFNTYLSSISHTLEKTKPTISKLLNS